MYVMTVFQQVLEKPLHFCWELGISDMTAALTGGQGLSQCLDIARKLAF